MIDFSEQFLFIFEFTVFFIVKCESFNDRPALNSIPQTDDEIREHEDEDNER